MAEGEDKVLVTGEQMQMKVLPAFAMDKVVNLNDLNDVEIDTVTDGDVLTWDGATSKWTNAAAN